VGQLRLRISFSVADLDRIKITYGYRPAEVGVVLSANERPDASFRVTKFRKGFYDQSKRRSVRVSLGCHIKHYSMPVPDMEHGPSQLAGITKRVAAAMPPIGRARLRSFKRFVKRFCNKYLKYLKFDKTEEFKFEEWLENAPYPAYRKAELELVYKRGLDLKKPKTDVKAFIKNEGYSVPKHFRGIYSRDDDYKCRVGPFMKKLGDRLFKTKWFIKKISVPDRPNAILEKNDGYDKIFCTDFSQYEATFIRELMKINHWVYNWCLEGHGLQKHFNDLFAYTAQKNKIKFKNFDCEVDSKRMSGEMDTSLGNGLMNLLITFYNLEQAGNDLDKVDAFFEGDDGIISCRHLPTAQMYTDLGANIKIEVPDDISTASFCGNVFDRDSMHNVTNPMEASVCFGWTDAKRYRYASKKIHAQLLRAKAMSMAYEYPACPILKSLSRYALRVTDHVKKDINETFLRKHSLDSYQYETTVESFKNYEKFGIPEIEITIGTRMLVERLYGITILKQLEVENYLDGLHELCELDVDLPFPKEWYQNDFTYSAEVSRYNTDPEFIKTGYTTPCYVDAQTIRYFHH